MAKSSKTKKSKENEDSGKESVVSTKKNLTKTDKSPRGDQGKAIKDTNKSKKSKETPKAKEQLKKKKEESESDNDDSTNVSAEETTPVVSKSKPSPDSRKRKRKAETLNPENKQSNKKDEIEILLVKRIHPKKNIEDYQPIFDACGTVEKIRWKTSFSGKSNRGYCYVKYTTNDDQQKALKELNGKKVLGRELKVEMIKVPPETPTKRLFVQGITRGSTKAEDIKELFSKFGEVTDVTLKNAAFVEFIDIASATKAYNATLTLAARRLYIDYSYADKEHAKENRLERRENKKQKQSEDSTNEEPHTSTT